MNKFIIGIIACTIITSSNAKELTNAQNAKIKQEITKAMDKSVNCWNNGDLKCFMDSYVHSDKTLFISGNKFIHGWQASYDHYKKKYGDNKQGMGKLQITITGIQALDDQHAYLYGKWHLLASGKEYSGVTSLIFEKISGQWQILLDHSN